ncbi:MAG: MotA/TolQ/ExbB proton channel family protein [Betaproteobacteria bacterium]|nr:MotA/TolQ/ExbB proton channel family protein [Betaproteobacteria bacterium]
MQQQFTPLAFWTHGDLVIQSVAVILLLLSVVSWYLIAAKAIAQFRLSRAAEKAVDAFWNAQTVPEALEAARKADSSGIFSALALTATQAAQIHHQRATKSVGAGVSASEFITRALRQRLTRSKARIDRGLVFLASVGATAPFIGLFGTVWGIYHALIGLTGQSQVVLDKVAGPVGEALIMTAAGLFVAIPAVLAYNAFTRGIGLILAEMDGFAHDLHAYFTTGETVRMGQVRALKPVQAA